jgi:hypothetical protein
MLHEPKFQILAAFLVAVFAGGIALAWPEKNRVVGIAMMAVSALGLILMYFYWPESSAAHSSPSISTSTQGGGTGGSYAGGGGGGAGAQGGPGGTYIQNQYNYGQSSPAPATIPARPDVTLRFIYPTGPALQLINQSGVTARDIKWTVAVWNLDLPDRTNPLPIPVTTFDFIMPHSSGGLQSLFDAPMVASLLHTGDHLIGSASVSCPDCARGRTFIVYIIWGHEGWFTEVLDKTGGELLIPRHFTKPEIEKYAHDLLSLVPQSARTPIGDP